MASSNRLSSIDITPVTDRSSVMRYFNDVPLLDQAIVKFATLEGEPNILTDAEIRKGFTLSQSDGEFKRFSSILTQNPEQFLIQAKTRTDEIYRRRIYRGLEVGGGLVLLLRLFNKMKPEDWNRRPPQGGSGQIPETPSEPPPAEPAAEEVSQRIATNLLLIGGSLVLGAALFYYGKSFVSGSEAVSFLRRAVV